MRITKETLLLRVVVRRVRPGIAPYIWEVRQVDASLPIHVSVDRFGSMEAAYTAGQARLAEFISKRPIPRDDSAKRFAASSQVSAGAMTHQ